MKHFFALLSGLVFGIGLLISGMANPAKVLNFLDAFGTWDPSLAFVMGGAIAVTAPGFALLFGTWRTPYFGSTFHLPTRNDLEPKLLTGAAIFGVGWGVGGFCPGPALTALPVAATGTLIFIPFMLVGMWIARHFPALASKRTEGGA